MPNMRNFKSKNTKIEFLIRKPLHRRGFRYKLHEKKLPGTPDLVFPKYNAIILIHGCFWHGHEKCPISHIPSSNADFWTAKIERNKKRDADNLSKLSAKGWRVLIVWECAIKNKKTDFVDFIDFIEGWLVGQAASTEMTWETPFPLLSFDK